MEEGNQELYQLSQRSRQIIRYLHNLPEKEEGSPKHKHILAEFDFLDKEIGKLKGLKRHERGQYKKRNSTDDKGTN